MTDAKPRQPSGRDFDVLAAVAGSLFAALILADGWQLLAGLMAGLFLACPTEWRRR